MKRHGHLPLATKVRAALLKMSAATIDRASAPQRQRCSGRRPRAGSISTTRRSIPVRTFSDWRDPPPRFVEADLVAHSGLVTRGAFVQTLVVTDIAPGWMELAPLLMREQTLLVDVLGEIVRRMVGYRRYEGTAAAEQLARLYALARLFVNAFQPCFKLAGRSAGEKARPQTDGGKRSAHIVPRLASGRTRSFRNRRSGRVRR
jgi:hypothetical protein